MNENSKCFLAVNSKLLEPIRKYIVQPLKYRAPYRHRVAATPSLAKLRNETRRSPSVHHKATFDLSTLCNRMQQVAMVVATSATWRCRAVLRLTHICGTAQLSSMALFKSATFDLGEGCGVKENPQELAILQSLSK